MAVVWSSSSNPNYTDGSLSTVNGFYRVEASNLGTSSTTVLSLGTDRTIAVTFANACNLQGVTLCLYPSVATGNKSVTVKLQMWSGSAWGDVAGATKTLTFAEICGDGTNYPTTNAISYGYFKTFLFATPAAVDTTASKWRYYISESGTTTSYSIRTSDGTNIAYAALGDNVVSYTTNQDQLIVHDTVLIDGTYTFKGALGTGNTTHSWSTWVCAPSTGLEADSVAKLKWKTPSASWTLTLDGIVAVGGHGGFRIGTSTSKISVANQAIVIVKRTPTLGSATNSGFGSPEFANGGSKQSSYFFYGDEPTYKYTKLTYDAVNGGTATMTIANPCVVTKSNHYLRSGYPAPVQFTTTGALPTGITASTTYYARYIDSSTFHLYDTYANAVAGGTTGRVVTSGTQSGTHTLVAIYYTDDALDWSVGNTVYCGRANSGGAATDVTTDRTIATISGREVTITPAPAAARRAGGIFYRVGDFYGVILKNDTVSNQVQYIGVPSNFVAVGTRFQYLNFYNSSSGYTPTDYSTFMSQWVIDGCLMNAYGVFNAVCPPENGISVTDCVLDRGGLMNTSTAGTPSLTTGNGTSGTVTIDGVVQIGNNYGNVIYTNAATKNTEIKNSYFQNGSISVVRINGYNISFHDNRVWSVSPNTGCLYLENSVGFRSYNNYYDYQTTCAVSFVGATVDFQSNNDVLGAEVANTADFLPFAGYFVQAVIKSPTGTPIIGPNYIYLAPTSYIAVEDSNNTANVDIVYDPYGIATRCGTGLADTTALTGSSYSQKYTPNSGTNSINWSFDVPTGNIQGVPQTIGILVKLNNTAYYAGTHEMPRILVTYDNGTTTYGEAEQGSTNEQFIHAAFTPTTTYGKITVSLTAKTNATGTNGVVYWGAFAGNLVNTTLANWSNGRPVSPVYSFNFNPSDVHRASSTLNYGTNTMGELLKIAEKKVDDTTALIVGQ